MSYYKRLLLLIPLLLLNSCGLLYYKNESTEHYEMRKQGYELCHLKSCGPQAVNEALKCLNIDKSQIEIGKEMQDTDIYHYRSILSIVHHDFCKITCPPDLIRYCKRIGLSVQVAKDISEVKPGDVAIILIRGKDRLREWHYACYPRWSIDTIMSFFKQDTVFISAYILTPKL